MLAYDHVPEGHLPLATLETGTGIKGKLTWAKKRNHRTSGSMVVAHDRGKVVAALIYGHCKLTGLLRLFVGWVHPRWRRRGIAKQLFLLVVGLVRPRRISAAAVSEDGQAYMAWMRIVVKVPVVMRK